MPNSLSPLRYPGGKTSLSKFLANVISINGLSDGIYIEPFAGGAGAAFFLLFNEYVFRIILNDADEFIYKFWRSVLYETEELLKRINDTPIRIDEWSKQKQLLKDRKLLKSASNLDIGFATLYLNRCNRSGIHLAGPIGGFGQAGKWKLDARFKKSVVSAKIERIALYKDRIELFNKDGIEFLKSSVEQSETNLSRTFAFLDPPYFEKGPTLFRLYFTRDDHVELASFMKNQIRYRWLISYDDIPFINNLYKENQRNGVMTNHFAYRAKVGKELIISSDNCLLPNHTHI